MNSPNPPRTNILRAGQIVFYVLFIVLWFKDNFPPLRRLPISAAIPLAGLLIVTAVRAVLRFRSSPPKLRFKFSKDWGALVLILLLITAVRVPDFLHPNGLMDSDEAIPALQGKHMAEGNIPAVYYYQALFQGSLPQHYYALLFKLFGYSVFLVKLAAFLAFVAFLVLQYALLKKIYSAEFALVAAFFYVLPFRHLLLASFDVGSGFPVVFLLGLLIFTLTYKICDQGQDHLLAALGFVMGLAFWTHQISIVFILTSGLFLLLRYKIRIKKYLVLALYFLIGVLPVLMSEIYWKFALVRALSGGESTGLLTGSKVTRGLRLLLELVSSGPKLANAITLVVLVLGLVVLFAAAAKRKKLGLSSLIAVYFLVFAAVYLASSSSGAEIIRYLYILYIALPVGFIAAFSWIRPKGLRYGFPLLFFMLLFLASGAKTSLAHYRRVNDLDKELTSVTGSMIATGEKYWIGDYWVSYLINAVSRERLIVASNTVERYPYYRLVYDSESPHMNCVFIKDVVLDPAEEEKKTAELTALLSRLSKTFQTQSMDQWRLVYGIDGYVYPKNLVNAPDEIPEVTLDGIGAADEGLVLRFSARRPLLTGGYRLHADISGYCALFAPLAQGDHFSIRLPYPPERNVRLKYYLDFQGLTLDSTIREIDAVLPAAPATMKPPPIEPLYGFGPRENVTGKNWQALEKEVRFQVNRPVGPSTRIVLNLFSPLGFDDPWWHGKFVQNVDVSINDRWDSWTTLADGDNTLTIDGRAAPFRNGPNIITLRFKYALLLSKVKDHWKTAAYLKSLKID